MPGVDTEAKINTPSYDVYIVYSRSGTTASFDSRCHYLLLTWLQRRAYAVDSHSWGPLYTGHPEEREVHLYHRGPPLCFGRQNALLLCFVLPNSRAFKIERPVFFNVEKLGDFPSSECCQL